MYEAPIDISQGQQFFRLRQNVANAKFGIIASADANGYLNPSGVLSVPGTGTQVFTAMASNNYGIGNWYLDGELVQSNAAILTLSNIISDHTVLVTFPASNDIAVAVSGLPLKSEVALLTNDFIYEVWVANTGLGETTGVVMTN